jgi:preprotein translocase subunit SecA
MEAKAQQIHTISQLVKAYCLYQKDVQYVVQDNKVIIVDENTGRLMTGRRWSDGLHQAVEAKEGVEVERETQTYATITIQNYFRLYHKLAGMTGTAETEAQEFFDIYKLGVLVIPTNRVIARKDAHDTVYKTKREKFLAVLKEVQTIHAQGRPILVGTVSVETSELLSKLLKKAGIIHSVLNAKFHEQEAEIVARAGQKGSVTIATNMAGRGTDIKLGPGVQELGGLHVLATERHEARRIDRQLRGRCARQGDAGSSHFFIALEDDLMRLFGSDKIVKYMEKMGLEEGQELEHPFLNRSIETAQKRVEQHHYQTRKRTLEYDDVMNKQREVLYGFRNEIIHGDDVRDRLMDVMEEVVIQKVQQFTSSEDVSELPARHARGRDRQSSQRRHRDAGSGFGLRWAHRRPVLRLQLHLEGRAGRLRVEDQLRESGGLGVDGTEHDPDGDRQIVAGTSLQHGRPAQQHRPARLRPARSVAGVQGGSVQDLWRADGQHQDGDLSQHLPQRIEPAGI